MTAIALPRTPARARKARAEAAQLGAWTRNIICAWRATTDEQRAAGAEWYDTAYLECAAIDPENPERPVGVVSAISPLQLWETNVRQARRLIHAVDNLLEVPQVHTEPMQSQAVRIALGESPWDVLKGPKIRAFAAAILGDKNAVVVDRWAYRVATRREYKGLTPHQYVRLALAYVRAADKLGEDPRTVQAATWVAAREAAERRSATTENSQA